MRALPLLITSLVLALSACGGGGGGGEGSGFAPDPEPPAPPGPSGFSVSGTITAAVGQGVDSDTNDPVREAVDNNTLATAQVISNPVTMGGYVNRPGTGEEGRSFASGDIDDYFLVDLLAGQRITMLVGDFLRADADLYLYNAEGEVVAFSRDTGEVESILVEEDGEYYVNAFAFAGATTYTLAIGSNNPQALPSASSEIIPWQAIVKYKDSGHGLQPAAQQTLHSNIGMQQQAGERGRNRLMALRSAGSDDRQLQHRLGSAIAKRAAIKDPALRARWETLMTIKQLRQDPSVELAEPNYRLRTNAVPNDQSYPLQWHYPLIGLPEAWESTNGIAEVTVAVIDTGILPDHPDFDGQLVPGYDFVRDADSAADGDGIDSDPRDPGDSLGGGGSFHGTHVSGTVAARGNNGIGVAGVAFGATVMPLRALGTDGGTSYDVAQAIRYAAGLSNDSGELPERAADVINLSLGGAGFSQSTQDLLETVRERGVIVVAAAGNEASNSPSYPAAYDGVISVSAVDSQKRLAPYSNIGPTIDVAAPGGNNGIDLTGDGYPDGVLSTGGSVNSNTLSYVYSFANGTSMASPHVAGVIALMRSINPDLTPEDVDALLSSGALTEDIGAPGRDDNYGHGLIGANLAVRAALESIGSSPSTTPRLVTSASALNFGAATSELALTLGNGGEGELNLLSVSTTEPWLSVAPINADSFGLGDYRVIVDRNNLSAGIYAADIVAQSSVNSVSIRVFMSVGGVGLAADVGVLYVLLYDPALDETVSQFVAVGDDGVYNFAFSDVPEGEYEIIAGSDADNDLFICDPGESCGAYLTTDQPVRLQVDRNFSDLDFLAEFLVSLPNIAPTEDTANSTTSGSRQKGGNHGIARKPDNNSP